eukprot:549717-Pyramimonas_sp.AAC.1
MCIRDRFFFWAGSRVLFFLLLSSASCSPNERVHDAHGAYSVQVQILRDRAAALALSTGSEVRLSHKVFGTAGARVRKSGGVYEVCAQVLCGGAPPHNQWRAPLPRGQRFDQLVITTGLVRPQIALGVVTREGEPLLWSTPGLHDFM